MRGVDLCKGLHVSLHVCEEIQSSDKFMSNTQVLASVHRMAGPIMFEIGSSCW